jgi:uncharacterized Zn-binding protein involved in type VI secretion
MPAATLGDMHVCPMVTPGTPPIPHVGGPITLGSTGVFIGGKPAARMGDMAVCVGPPSTIILGCMTVLIGEAGGGGGGGGGGGAGSGGGGGSAATGAATSASIAGQSPQSTELTDNFLDIAFYDKANLPIGGLQYKLTDPDNKVQTGFLAGQIKRSGVPKGDYTVELRGIVNAQWSTKQADVGTAVTLKVDTLGVDDGNDAKLEIYVRDGNYADHLLATIEAKVSGDQVQTQWTLQVDEKLLSICDSKGEKGKYSQPFFFFKVSIGELAEQSGILYLNDWTEIVLQDDDGKIISNKNCRIALPNGEIRESASDSNGKMKIEGIPPGNLHISFE